jgi:hypothetical protein
MSKKDKEPEIEIPEGATPEEIADIYLAEEEEEEIAVSDTPPIDLEEAGLPDKAATPGIETILAQADPMKGDKDPIVVEWCRNNLSREEFEARYAGRKCEG